MTMLKTFYALALFMLCSPVLSARGKFYGFCEQGGKKLVTNNAPSVGSVQASYPQCTVTIYVAGTTTLATLYTSASGGANKTNPFSADNNAYWFAYLDGGSFDIQLSGGGLPAPYTLSDMLLIDAAVVPVSLTTDQIVSGQKTFTKPVVGMGKIIGFDTTGAAADPPVNISTLVADNSFAAMYAIGRLYVQSSGFGGTPASGTIVTRGQLGTLAFPTALTTGTEFGSLKMQGFDGTSYNARRVSLFATASENWNSVAQGAYLSFETTATGSVNTVEKMRLTDMGSLLINTTTSSSTYKLNVNGAAYFSGDAVMAANATLTGNLGVGGNTSITGNLTVTGTCTGCGTTNAVTTDTLQTISGSKIFSHPNGILFNAPSAALNTKNARIRFDTAGDYLAIEGLNDALSTTSFMSTFYRDGRVLQTPSLPHTVLSGRTSAYDIRSTEYVAGLEVQMGAGWNAGFNFGVGVVENIRSQVLIPSSATPVYDTATGLNQVSFFDGFGSHVVSQAAGVAAVGSISRAWNQVTDPNSVGIGQGVMTSAINSTYTGTINITQTSLPPAVRQQGENLTYPFYARLDNEWMTITARSCSMVTPGTTTLTTGATCPAGVGGGALTYTIGTRGIWGTIPTVHSTGTSIYTSTGGYAFGDNPLAIGGTVVNLSNQEIVFPARLIGQEINMSCYGPCAQLTGMLFNGTTTMNSIEPSKAIDIERSGYQNTLRANISASNTFSVISYIHRLSVGDKVLLNGCTAGSNDNLTVTVTSVSSTTVFNTSALGTSTGACNITKTVNGTFNIPWDFAFWTEDGSATVGVHLGSTNQNNTPLFINSNSQSIEFKANRSDGGTYTASMFSDSNGMLLVKPAIQSASALNYLGVINQNNGNGASGVAFSVSASTENGGVPTFKGGFGLLRTNTFGRGDAVILLNNTGDGSSVSNTSIAFRVYAAGGFGAVGTPTSAAGLPSGAVWRDAAASNVLKMVP